MSAEQKQQTLEAKAAEAEVDDYGEEDEEEYEEYSSGQRFLLFTAMPGWLVSMVVHAVGLLILALVTVGPDVEQLQNIITAAPPSEEIQEIEEFQEELVQPLDVDVTTDMVADAVAMEFTEMVPEDVTEVSVATDLDSAAISVELFDFGEETAPKSDLYKTIGSFTGSGLEGRGEAARRALVAQHGGTAESEAAVAAALRWLAAVQLPDGGWSFDHRLGPPNEARRSRDPGNLQDARNGATAMGVLPFLGAGQTHVEGSYQRNVQGALAYLVNSMKSNGSLHESGGTMYSHGLAAIALTEAFGMTNDRALMAPAQASLNFISYAQDPVGGGWRYQVRQPGDTSVVGWKLMALKSGHMAYLQVNPNTIRGAERFLDSVAMSNGAYYGYTSPARRSTMTSIGLLCRMYLGWTLEHEGLQEGVRYLSDRGPSRSDMYYNYYATQVMRQVGGEYWEKWNEEMRDYLVRTQVKEGPEKGSWHFDCNRGGVRGGRLYNTSLATLILEVYYRHLPIYQQQATTDEFPL